MMDTEKDFYVHTTFGRLMDLMFSESRLLRAPQAKERLINLLSNHAQVLSDHGERDLARSVMDFAEGLRTYDARSSRRRH